ncbi:hypothetical protein [Streptomyces akebiae]|uniref:Uncharacterized protein n=1 Tax=Streptomyces akebiae TaxID=2865673 RepID=A0ABX8Y441_9ACTN|nr:hypothetical protein [Streptomyces akebiae]QYX82618.1 hypothetical protein K1J60_44160 [Streptomyces akebiae]
MLRYSLPSGFRASWASHLDIADAATVLFERTDITGVVSVGQYPAISGEDLAETFSTRLGRTVSSAFRPGGPPGASGRTLMGDCCGDGPN